jgi:hypothetical protein
MTTRQAARPPSAPMASSVPSATVCSQSPLPGKDPAGILETEGATTLRKILHDRALPLSAIVIDAHLDPWERRLRDPEGPLPAMRSTATLIAALLPRETAQAIRQITGNAELQTLNERMQHERMQPVTNPALAEIARTLPADHACQIVRTAERLGFTDSGTGPKPAQTIRRPAS